MNMRAPKNPDEFMPTRRTLLSRLKDWDDHESWREFFNTYWRLIHCVALKSGLTEPEAQDVVQETVLSVAKTMNQFKYDPVVCSFKSWLRHLTTKRIADQFRKRAREGLPDANPRADTSRTATIDRIPDPASFNLDMEWDKEWEQNLVDAAIERVKTLASAEQYQMFDYYVLREWPVLKVMSALGVNRAQVYLAKHRVTNLIKKEVQRLKKKMV
jgi:RNA polymerase sigma factor (sigma-70 family)